MQALFGSRSRTDTHTFILQLERSLTYAIKGRLSVCISCQLLFSPGIQNSVFQGTIDQKRSKQVLQIVCTFCRNEGNTYCTFCRSDYTGSLEVIRFASGDYFSGESSGVATGWRYYYIGFTSSLTKGDFNFGVYEVSSYLHG